MSHVGRTGLLSYNSSKHALLGLTRAPYPTLTLTLTLTPTLTLTLTLTLGVRPA